MIKKITLVTVATLSLMTLNVQAEGMKCAAGKCGASMKQAKQGGNMMQNNKMKKKKKATPFLIKRGLPHMTKMIMKSWDDPKLALTPEQKEKLLVVRKETMGAVMRLKPEVMALEKEIVQASKAGTKASELKAKVEKLAALEVEATMVHLNCLDNTKSVLKPEQMSYLMEKAKAQRAMKKAAKMNGMNCTAANCAGMNKK